MNCIVPPHILQRLLADDREEVRKAAMSTLLTATRLRGERAIRGSFAGLLAPGAGRRTVFDCRRRWTLVGAVLARSENGAASPDKNVNEAFDGLGKTRDFYQDIFGRDSIDNRGMRLDAYVHYGVNHLNAGWDGQQMRFGDGDGVIFGGFTGSLDVIAHELTHGVTDYTAGLEYHNQSGALNESMSDVMGSLVKQWSLKQTAQQADWLIGADIFTPGIPADALRSMKAPGTAYDNDLWGKDPQPGHMRDFVHLPDTEDNDNGGVHINSGIPNKAFYLTATKIGGYAWEAPGRVWYDSLLASTQTTDFQGFADTTYAKAGQLYGQDSAEQRSVESAWDEVGITVNAELHMARVSRNGSTAESDHAAGLAEQVAELSVQVESLRRDLERKSKARR